MPKLFFDELNAINLGEIVSCTRDLGFISLARRLIEHKRRRPLTNNEALRSLRPIVDRPEIDLRAV